MRRSFLYCLFLPASFFGAMVANCQGFPNKPIRILTAEPGSPNDLLSRMISPQLTATLGEQIVVDNRGISAIEIAAKSPADGYTLLSYGAPLWLSSLLRRNVRWDPFRDFLPVTLALSAPCLLVVAPSVPARTVTELISLARTKPGELNYGSSSGGSVTHLAGELFKSMAKVNLVRINYKGNGPAIAALIASEVQIMIPNVGAVLPHVNSGRLRALAVTSLRPFASLPNIPTVTASGIPGFEVSSISGILAPARTPAEIVNKLNLHIVQILNAAEFKEKFLLSGMEVVASSPDAFSTRIKADISKWRSVISEAGISED